MWISFLHSGSPIIQYHVSSSSNSTIVTVFLVSQLQCFQSREGQMSTPVPALLHHSLPAFIVSLIHYDILKKTIFHSLFSKTTFREQNKSCWVCPRSAQRQQLVFASLQAVSGRCNGEVTVVLPFWKTFRIWKEAFLHLKVLSLFYVLVWLAVEVTQGWALVKGQERSPALLCASMHPVSFTLPSLFQALQEPRCHASSWWIAHGRLEELFCEKVNCCWKRALWRVWKSNLSNILFNTEWDELPFWQIANFIYTFVFGLPQVVAKACLGEKWCWH